MGGGSPHPTFVWPKAKLHGGNPALPIGRKLDSRFTEHGLTPQSKTQLSHSQSLASGSLRRPLILRYQRADKIYIQMYAIESNVHCLM